MRIGGLLGLVTLLAATPVSGGGFSIPDIGVRRTGMGAVIGRPDEAAIYHNPAGLILNHGWHLYLSGGVALISTEFQLHSWERSDEFLGVNANADGYYNPTKPSRAMGVIPLLAASGEIIPDKLVLGTALFVGNAQGAQFDEKAITRYHLIDGYVVAPQAVVAGAYRLLPSITAGASVGLMNIRIKGQRDVFPIFNGTDISNLAGTSPRLELEGSGWAPTWMVAAFGQPHPKITWGFTLTGRIDATLEGPIKVTYSDDAATPGDTLEGTQKTKQFLPWTFMAGANVDVHPNVEVGGELRYWLYRQYKQQHTDVTGIFLLRELEVQKNYNDSWQVSGGARIHDLPAIPKLEMMLGTHYDRTPSPTRSLTFDQPTFRHIGLHTGVRYTTGRFCIGASYLHYWYLVPTVNDSITMPPSDFKGSGTNNIFTISLDATL